MKITDTALTPITFPAPIYELPPDGFALHDAGAGYHVARQPVRPIGLTVVDDLLAELASATSSCGSCRRWTGCATRSSPRPSSSRSFAGATPASRRLAEPGGC
jgi:hypothetical protein